MSHMHVAHALSKFWHAYVLSRPACMQADQNLGKITAPHFGVLITQNVNKNMPNRILIASLNENLPDCNENLGGYKKQEPLLHSCLLASS